ncbi:CGNR zinc finger domain-containing protein, partial [Streptomyces sp. NPDC059851]|uniref:CGNR zinc finger domain-containing protein n=1 Tax=Streptomyces sp. NPDC059851 TaxID=3346971 RepID=UPI00365048B5
MTDSAQGFSAARRLVDLAEAVRADPGLPRAGLTALLARHGEDTDDLTAGAFTEADAADLRAAARRMAGVLAEPDEDRAAEALNDLFAQYATRPRLTRHGGHPWHLHVDRGDEAGWGEWFLASGALALAQLLTEHGRIAWGACAASGCGRLFLGGGPGSARRYCSGTCATRERVAAHRRRKRAEAAAEVVGPAEAGADAGRAEAGA